MANFSSFTDFRLLRDLKVFLHLRLGVARGSGPETLYGDGTPDLEHARQRLEAKSRQLEKRDREVSRLRAKLEEKGGGASPEDTDGFPPVFFIVGRGKSGTSWLMRMLDSHPEILCRGEGRFFGRDWKRDDLLEEQAGVASRTLYGAISESEHLRHWVDRSVWSRDEDTERQLAEVAGAATRHFLAEKLSKAGKSMVGDKTPLLTPDSVKEIAEACPEAKVIHIIRDGRDVTVSAVHHQWNRAKDQGGSLRIRPEEVEKREAYRKNPRGVLDEGMFTEKALRGRAEAWKNFVSKPRQDGPALLGENYTEVRYEDLLEHPEREVERLLGFLGAASDEKTAKKCVKAASFEKLSKGRKPGEEDSTSFYRKGISGDWRNVFTEKDKQVFKAAAGDLLIELGYETNDGW